MGKTRTIYLGNFSGTTPGAAVDCRGLDTDGASIIVKTAVGASGGCAVETKTADGTDWRLALSKGGTAGAYSTILALGVNGTTTLAGQHQEIRVNPNMTAGSQEMWLIAEEL